MRGAGAPGAFAGKSRDVREEAHPQVSHDAAQVYWHQWEGVAQPGGAGDSCGLPACDSSACDSCGLPACDSSACDTHGLPVCL